MRLKTLSVTNFRGYKNYEISLHPQFNLIVGENGLGKTSLLEAAAVAVGSWLLGIRGHDSRAIRARDVRILRDLVEGRYRELSQYPVKVTATAELTITQAKRQSDTGKIELIGIPKMVPVAWSRSLEGTGGRTTQQDAKSLKKYATAMEAAVLKGDPCVLPLIRYFGAGRLWESVKDSDNKSMSKFKAKQPQDLHDDDDLQKLLLESKKMAEPFFGYRFSVDKRCNPDDLLRWMYYERQNERDDEKDSNALRTVYLAIEKMLPSVKRARYSVKQSSLMIYLDDGRILTFDELSDGYRNVVALAADLAIKAVMLNPHLAESALDMTPGVVLIDELDLHLHPTWQREIVEAFRSTFPKFQFICTTHSPFLIQSLRSGDELIRLDGDVTNGIGNLSIEGIAAALMGVPNTDASLRYAEMLSTAKEYLVELDEAAKSSDARLAEYRKLLAARIAPYAENPAFQAILEAEKKSMIGS